MNILKFINLFYKIKLLFVYLPKGLQSEVVDDMQKLYELCLIARLEKTKGDKK